MRTTFDRTAPDTASRTVDSKKKVTASRLLLPSAAPEWFLCTSDERCVWDASVPSCSRESAYSYSLIALSVVGTIVGIALSLVVAVLSVIVSLTVLGLRPGDRRAIFSVQWRFSRRRRRASTTAVRRPDRPPEDRVRSRYVDGELDDDEFERELERVLGPDERRSRTDADRSSSRRPSGDRHRLRDH